MKKYLQYCKNSILKNCRYDSKPFCQAKLELDALSFSQGPFKSTPIKLYFPESDWNVGILQKFLFNKFIFNFFVITYTNLFK